MCSAARATHTLISGIAKGEGELVDFLFRQGDWFSSRRHQGLVEIQAPLPPLSWHNCLLDCTEHELPRGTAFPGRGFMQLTVQGPGKIQTGADGVLFHPPSVSHSDLNKSLGCRRWQFRHFVDRTVTLSNIAISPVVHPPNACATFLSVDFAEQLKSSVDIVKTIGEYVRLKRTGSTGRYMGLCPFHTEKTPSFNVNVSMQRFKCFGCGLGGDVFNFIMEIERVSFVEAMKLLAERNGIAMPKREYTDPDSKLRGALMEMHEIAAQVFHDNLN